MMKPSARLTLNWGILIAALLALAGSLYLYRESILRGAQKKKKRGGGGFSFPVKTAKVGQGVLPRTLGLFGDIVSYRSATVRAEVTGVVKAIARREGQPVKAGEPLLRLDDRDLKLALYRRQAQAMQASSAVARYQAELSKAEDLVIRLTKLHKEKLVSDEEMRRARLAQSAAKAQIGESRASASLGYVEVRIAQRDVDRATIKAPISGILSRRFVDAGDRVTAGTTVAEVVGGRRIELRLFIPSRHVGQVTAGQKLRYRAAARRSRGGGKRPWSDGVIDRVLPVADPSSRNQVAVVSLPEPPRGLTPGLPVEALVNIGQSPPAALVPRDALTRFGEGWVVFKVGPAPGKKKKGLVALRVPVEILASDELQAAVKAKLVAGDRVVVLGNEALFPFAPVRPVGGPKPSMKHVRR